MSLYVWAMSRTVSVPPRGVLCVPRLVLHARGSTRLRPSSRAQEGAARRGGAAGGGGCPGGGGGGFVRWANYPSVYSRHVIEPPACGFPLGMRQFTSRVCRVHTCVQHYSATYRLSFKTGNECVSALPGAEASRRRVCGGSVAGGVRPLPRWLPRGTRRRRRRRRGGSSRATSWSAPCPWSASVSWTTRS